MNISKFDLLLYAVLSKSSGADELPVGSGVGLLGLVV